MCDGDQGDVVVPASPGAAFEVGQAQGLLHLTVVVLDPPAQFRGAHEGGQRRVGGQVGEPELDGFGFGGGLFGQQPAHGQFRAVAGIADLASGGTDPQGHETGVHALDAASAAAGPGAFPPVHRPGRLLAGCAAPTPRTTGMTRARETHRLRVRLAGMPPVRRTRSRRGHVSSRDTSVRPVGLVGQSSVAETRAGQRSMSIGQGSVSRDTGCQESLTTSWFLPADV